MIAYYKTVPQIELVSLAGFCPSDNKTQPWQEHMYSTEFNINSE